MNKDKTSVLSNSAKSGLLQAFCIFLGLVLMAPVIYCVLISFMHEAEIVTTDIHLWPDEFYLGMPYSTSNSGHF